VRAAAATSRRTMVCLDSNHTAEHVRAELDAYAPLVSPGCYCVVFDTIVEHMPASLFTDRPWAPGNSPMTAVTDFLATHPEFEVDHGIDGQLLLSVAPGGYLRRTSP
jgi:cephalosporin hydroxylase